MQKLVLCLGVLCLVAIASAFPQQNPALTAEQEAKLDEKAKAALKRLETINIDQVVKRKRVIQAHLKCVLDEGPCDSVGNNIKVLIPYALKDKCDSCTEEQRNKILKVARTIKKDHAVYYQRILEKYFNGKEPVDIDE